MRPAAGELGHLRVEDVAGEVDVARRAPADAVVDEHDHARAPGGRTRSAAAAVALTAVPRPRRAPDRSEEARAEVASDAMARWYVAPPRVPCP